MKIDFSFIQLKENGVVLQTIKFGLVGVLNTIIGYGVYFVLLKLNVFYVIALFFCHVAGVANSYFWNKYWTFQSKQKSFKELFRFITVYIITFVINLLLLMVLVEKLQLSKELAGFLALIITMCLSFLGHKLWSFRNLEMRRKDT